MPSPLGTAIKFASSPMGRKAIRQVVRAARTEEGRKLIAQARKAAATPEVRKLIEQAKQVARLQPEAEVKPESDKRLEGLRGRLRRRTP